jgi:acyl-coenzyme A synthetase/AMP-(fatty) acid ligase
MTYTDVLQIYGLSRAGYIPQLFSLRLSSAEVVFELLQKAGAKALIYDFSYQSLVGDILVPTYPAANVKDANIVYGDLPQLPEVATSDDTVFIYHTSGSTSGSPKLVPWSYSFLNGIVYKCIQALQMIPGQQDVITWMGNVCHAGQHLGTYTML